MISNLSFCELPLSGCLQLWMKPLVKAQTLDNNLTVRIKTKKNTFSLYFDFRIESKIKERKIKSPNDTGTQWETISMPSLLECVLMRTKSWTSIWSGHGILPVISSYLLSWERRDYFPLQYGGPGYSVFVSVRQQINLIEPQNFVGCVCICCTGLWNISGVDSCFNRKLHEYNV